MTEDANRRAREQVVAQLLSRTGLPNAPMAMPKQALEAQPRWLFAIYARLLRRT